MVLQFVNPYFLFALSAISVPIIVHLYNFRKYKKVFFTNVRFLQSIQQTTRSQSKLKHLLILACRLLAVIFLVLAFAQPFIAKQHSILSAGSTNYVSIFVDNSFSMNNKNTEGVLLEQALQKAAAVANAYKASDKLQLLTCDFTPQQQRFVTKDIFLKELAEVKLSSISRTFSDVIQKQQSLWVDVENGHKQSYIISDFQKSMFDNISITKVDSGSNSFFIPIQSSENENLSIDTCYFTAPVIQAGQATKLIVKIKNNGHKTFDNVPLKLFVNRENKAIAIVNCPAKAIVEDTLTFTIPITGWNSAMVSLTDFPITFDNDYYLSFFIAPAINVVCINGAQPNKYIHKLFEDDPYFKIADFPVNQLSYTSFITGNAIVLNELPSISSGLAAELKKAVQRGATLVIFPAANSDMVSYNGFLSALAAPQYGNSTTTETRIEKLDKQNPLLQDVFAKTKNREYTKEDFPVVKHYFAISKKVSTGGTYNLITCENADIFLALTKMEKGDIYQFASALNSAEGNFAEHALFVPVLYKIILNSLHTQTVDYTIGNNSVSFNSDGGGADNILHIVNNDKHFDIIPERKFTGNNATLEIHNQVTEAGNYDLRNNKALLSTVSFNYNRRESDMTMLSNTQLEAIAEKLGMKNIAIIKNSIGTLTKAITESSRGIALWKLCIVLVLLSLAAEMAVIKFLK